jgi:hypothetical protein
LKICSEEDILDYTNIFIPEEIIFVMSDLILEARVKFTPACVDGIFEVPIQVEKAIFNHSGDSKDSTKDLRERVKRTQALRLMAKRALAITRGDNLIIEAKYDGYCYRHHKDLDEGGGRYLVSRVHVVSDSKKDGIPQIDATYYFSEEKPSRVEIIGF